MHERNGESVRAAEPQLVPAGAERPLQHAGAPEARERPARQLRRRRVRACSRWSWAPRPCSCTPSGARASSCTGGWAGRRRPSASTCRRIAPVWRCSSVIASTSSRTPTTSAHPLPGASFPAGPRQGCSWAGAPIATRSSCGSRTDWVRDKVDSLLNVLRAALGLQLLEERVRLNYKQAAEVQDGLTREDSAPAARLRDRLSLAGRRGARRGLLRLRPRERRHGGARRRRRQRPRPAGRAAGARRRDGAAHGVREAAAHRARVRQAEPGDPPQQPVEPLRLRLLRRARVEREPELRQRRPPAARCCSARATSSSCAWAAP